MEELRRFTSIICWLDDARWATDELWSWWDHEACKALNSEQKVLAHWITSITNMQMSANAVWKRGLPILAELVQDYTEALLTPRALMEKYSRPVNKSKRTVRTLSNRSGLLDFTPRYSRHYDQITRTLEILIDYNRSLVRFLQTYSKQYKQKELSHVAHALDLLTYRWDVDKARPILNSVIEMDQDFQRWQRDMNRPQGHGRKRLWMALRDYVKTPFKHWVEESFSWPENLDLRELELPGDVWNNEFAIKLLHPLAARNGVTTKTLRGASLSAPALAKQIDMVVRSIEPTTCFYPERLDVSFDFASRMCGADLCSVCLFGKNLAKEFCVSQNPTKLCPVLFVSAGYIRPCEPQSCPVANDFGKHLCNAGLFSRQAERTEQ